MKSVVALACLLFASAVTAESPVTGRGLIEKMSSAMQGLNYTGTFVYVHDGGVEAMSVQHSWADGIERERLVSLNGEPREIVRNAEHVVCIWPGTKSVSVSKPKPRAPFPEFDANQLAELAKIYEFTRAGNDRVAGRDAEIVDISPLDDYRYGYRLWIDTETSLLLQSVMSDSQQRIIEQVMFTDIEVVEHIPLATFEASLKGPRYQWLVDLDRPFALPPTAESKIAESQSVGSDIPAIELGNAPAGFALMSDEMVMLTKKSEVRRVMYSDGLSSLSVYVAQSDGDAKNVLHGSTGMGAVHAYGVMLDKWHITVVGEVPKATVKMIGDNLSLVAR